MTEFITKMHTAVKFAYDGRGFHGYARQPKLKTIEGEIIKSLIKHGFVEDTEQSCFRSASRTDKGVSALGNVVVFNADSSKTRILQALSDDFTDIIFYGITNVEPDFFPRYAKQRSYRYYLKKDKLDAELAITAASSFTGEHNFSNFARVEEFKNPVRIINNIIVTEEDEFLIIDFYAQTFLWHQIRRTVSAIERVGRNELEKERIMDALNNPDKKVDFGLAPAEPLILKDIMYDFEFEYDKNQMDKLDSIEQKIVTSLLE
jgi:tRNA pseudouridine38-40 synthase